MYNFETFLSIAVLVTFSSLGVTQLLVALQELGKPLLELLALLLSGLVNHVLSSVACNLVGLSLEHDLLTPSSLASTSRNN